MIFIATMLAICLFFVALLAASEAALAATNRVRLRHLLQIGAQPSQDAAALHGDAAQLLSGELSGDARRFLATVTIAANVPILVAAALAVHLVAKLETGAAVAILAGASLVVVAALQIAPRLLVSRPGALDRLWWIRPARAFVALLRPPVGILLWLGDAMLRPLGLVRKRARDEPRAAGEIRDLVESAQDEDDENKELIESIFSFGDTRAREAMIPRPDIVSLPIDAPALAVLEKLEESGLSRLPLHEGGIDRIVGVLYAKDVLAALGRNDFDFSAKELVREPLYLPESQPIDAAFAAMRAARTHLAIVIDEYGGTAGLLTVEDILEELVGEIADEHDRPIDEPVEILDAHNALVDAQLHAEDLEEQWGVILPTGEFDSVGGFMIEQLGRALESGDRVELEHVALQVHSMRARRPHRILVTKVHSFATETQDAAS